MFVLNRCLIVKGTVGVTSSNLLSLEWCVRFTTVPFKPFTDQQCQTVPYLSTKIKQYLLRTLYRVFYIKELLRFLLSPYRSRRKITINIRNFKNRSDKEYLIFSRYSFNITSVAFTLFASVNSHITAIRTLLEK